MNRNLKKGVLAGLLTAVLGVGVVAGVVANNADPGNLVEIENEEVPLGAEPEEAQAGADTMRAPYTITVGDTQTNVVDLGKVTYNSPDAGTSVQFTLKDRQKDLYGTETAYVLSPISAMDNGLYEVKLDSTTMQPGGTITGTVTAKANVKLAPGSYPFQVGWLPQLDKHRIANVINIEAKVVPAELTIESIDPVNTHYGESINYEKVSCKTDHGTYTMADLGLSVADNGATLNVGKSQNCPVTVAQSAGYEIQNANNLTLTVNVTKTTPKVEWAKASGQVPNGSTLESVKVLGSATNPYNGKVVEGFWGWQSPKEVVNNSNGFTTTLERNIVFTPQDATNYEMPTDVKAPVTVMSGGSGGYSNPGTKDNPNLKVEGLNATYEWDGEEHPVKVSSSSLGGIVVTYTDAAGHECGKPKDVGEYHVTVDLDETGSYNGDHVEGTIKITQRSIKFTSSDAVYSRPYTGNNVAQVDISHILITGLPETKTKGVTPDGNGGFTVTSEDGDTTVTCGNVSATFNGTDVGYGYVATIKLNDVKVTGPGAENYAVSSDPITENGKAIMSRDVILSLFGKDSGTSKTITKKYGEALNLNEALAGGKITADFESDNGIRGLVGGTSTIEGLTLHSSGALSGAEVGKTYDITAWGNNSNYRIHVDSQIQVVQATPVPVEEPNIEAKEGVSLADIPVPNVAFKNPYNGDPVPGTVTWTDTGTKLGSPDTVQDCKYSFQPTQADLYQATTGIAKVKSTAGTPIPIQVDTPNASYDANGHGVNPTTTVSDANLTVTYRTDSSDDFGSAVPVNAGTYEYQIEATAPANSVYKTTTLSGKYVIGKAAPTGVPTITSSGETLQSFRLTADGITGTNGEAVSGTVSWDEPTTSVLRGNVYGWTFKSDDPNYADLTGELAPLPLVTDRSELSDKINDARGLLNSVSVSANGSDVSNKASWATQAEHDKLNEAINAADAVLKDTGCSQEDYNAAIEALDSAISDFNSAAKSGTKTASAPASSSGGGFSGGGSSSPAPAPSAPKATDDAKATPDDTKATEPETPEEPGDEQQAEPTPVVVEEHFYRLYNPATGEHLYTNQPSVLDAKLAEGWNNEVIAGAPKLPAKSSTPVYQLDNPYTGEHHYTLDANEYNTLMNMGWIPRDVVFYSADPATGMKVYRLFNPYAEAQGMGAAAHHYTYDPTELADLQSRGYQLDQNAGWFYLPADAVL